MEGSYQRGKEAGLISRNLDGPDVLPANSPEWQATLLEYVETRDRMYTLAAQGNKEASRQAEYLDGFLSVWD